MVEDFLELGDGFPTLMSGNKSFFAPRNSPAGSASSRTDRPKPAK
jgi:hypothetical protein